MRVTNQGRPFAILKIDQLKEDFLTLGCFLTWGVRTQDGRGSTHLGSQDSGWLGGIHLESQDSGWWGWCSPGESGLRLVGVLLLLLLMRLLRRSLELRIWDCVRVLLCAGADPEPLVAASKGCCSSLCREIEITMLNSIRFKISHRERKREILLVVTERERE